MKIISEHNFDEFANALQLSIKSKIDKVVFKDNGVLIYFDSRPARNDEKLYGFLDLFSATWDQKERCFAVEHAGDINWSQVTLFLLLTRMDVTNISKLTQIDKLMADVARRLGLKISRSGVDSVGGCSEAVFKLLKEKKMTIRELAEATGLTQVSISNFKSGKDIRLSNFLKIVKALGLNLKIYLRRGRDSNPRTS